MATKPLTEQEFRTFAGVWLGIGMVLALGSAVWLGILARQLEQPWPVWVCVALLSLGSAMAQAAHMVLRGIVKLPNG